MEMLPTDPIILLSVINMKLRDFYPSLDILCNDLDINQNELEDKLRKVGYEYNEESNRFM